MLTTENEIVNVLKSAKKPLKAREIASSLSRQKGARITRAEVNSALYKMKVKGILVIDEEFRWRLGREASAHEGKGSGVNRDREPTPKSPNYYEILNVTQEADPRVIQKVYKVLVTLYHPDRATPEKRQEFEEKMKLINVAYEILSDDRKRKEYDAGLCGQKL